MATHDPRIETLTRRVLAENGLPTSCSAILASDSPLTEIKLGNWSLQAFGHDQFFIESSVGLGVKADEADDARDIQSIKDALAGLAKRFDVER